MQQVRLLVAGAVVLGVFSGAMAATYTVSKDGRGAYTSIQAAIDASAADSSGAGDIVEILDAAVYSERVTVGWRSSGLTVRSSNPSLRAKPMVVWQDRLHYAPRSSADVSRYDSTWYTYNGAFRIHEATDVTIDGIGIDGGGAYFEGHTNVWGTSPQAFGNVALFIRGSLRSHIVRCDIRNACAGIYFFERNEGGVNANPNALDNPSTIVPLSSFGRMGNHVVEFNRIHNNSWGLDFHIIWDLSSTIRYNLIYENHHQSSAFATQVSTTPGGTYSCGGALTLSDMVLTPLAVYNNTMWHNYVNFYGQSKAGYHHLVFNNIVGPPFQHWSDAYPIRPNWSWTLDDKLVNRTRNSIYASQYRAPGVSSPWVYPRDTLINGTTWRFSGGNITAVTSMFTSDIIPYAIAEKTGYDTLVPFTAGTQTQLLNYHMANAWTEGARIVGTTADRPFPAAANVRWMESIFSSTDTSAASFLAPLWSNGNVASYVLNGGWQGVGMLDADGSIADIGAIPQGQPPSYLFTVNPLAPMIVNGTSADLSFEIREIAGSITNIQIQYIRFQPNVPYEPVAVIPEALPVTYPASTALRVGANDLRVTLPSAPGNYAFIEMVVKGTGPDGKTVVSDVGFIPYRKLEYKFVVEILDSTGNLASEVTAGKPVTLRITPQTVAGQLFDKTITPVSLSILGDSLIDASTGRTVRFPSGITGVVTASVIFTDIPPGGYDRASVTGTWTDANSKSLAFFGISNTVRIRPGPAARLRFRNPPSKAAGVLPTVLDPGITAPVLVAAYDAYGNQVDRPTPISIMSIDSLVGNILGGRQTKSTDTTGVAGFTAVVTGGNQDQIFTLVASLASGVTDTAQFKVGRNRMRLWIFYGDTLAYNDTVGLSGLVGEYLKVTIRAGEDAATIADTLHDSLILSLSDGMLAFTAPNAAVPQTRFKLTNGTVTAWIWSAGPVANGTIAAGPMTGDNSFLAGTRDAISFSQIALWILYSDTTGYVPATELRGMRGDYLKVTLRAGPDGVSPLSTRQDSVVLSLTNGITVYAVAGSSSPATAVRLRNGQATVWLSSREVIANGSISATPISVPATVLAATRQSIYFDTKVARAIGGYLQDLNADGRIETAVVRFDSLPAVPAITLYDPFAFDSARVSGSSTSSGTTVTYTFSPSLGPGTGFDAARATVVGNSDFSAAPFALDDSAAPVLIDTVHFRGGAPISRQTRQPDTLVVIFSEAIRGGVPAQAELLDFAGPSGVYSMRLTLLRSQGTTLTFVVDTIIGVLWPTDSDSARMSVGMFSDTLGNVQQNPANRSVPVDVRYPEVSFAVDIGPNPFTSGSRPLHIVVAPIGRIPSELGSVRARVSIYDAVGNTIVASADAVASLDGLLKYDWNGTNRNGRFVESGTYLAVIDVNQNGSHSTVRRKIGVRR